MLRIAPRPAGPADHRRQRPQGGPRQRRHLRDPERRRARQRSTCCEVDIGIRSIFRRLLPGRAAAALDPAAAAAHPAQLDPLGVLQHRRARPAAAPAPEHLPHRSSKRCTRPTWPTSSRNSARPSARPSSRPSTAKWPPRRSPRSDPKMQASILESLEPEKAADIVEEMSPDEAADVLAELEEETSEEILEEMESEPQDRGPGTARVRGGHRRRPDEHRVRGAARERHRGRRAWRRCKGNEDLLEDSEHAVPGRRRGAAGRRRCRWRALFVAAGDAAAQGPGLRDPDPGVAWTRSRTASPNCSTSTTC